MAEELPADLQEKIQRYQTLGAQLQSVAQQRSQMDMLRSEAKRAKGALEELDDDATVYRSLGGLMLRDDKAKALERVTEELETLEIRVKRVKDQEQALQQELQTLQADLQKAMQA